MSKSKSRNKGRRVPDINSWSIFATEHDLDEDAIIKGFNIHGIEAVVGTQTVVERVMVVGRKGELQANPDKNVFRCLVVYRHEPTGMLGVLSQDIYYGLLLRLQQLGRGERESL